MLQKLRQLWSLAQAGVGAGFTPGTVVTWIAKYGPLIEAMILFIEKERGDEAHRAAADKFERGFRVATATGDTSQLEEAIREHCGKDGCVLP